MRFKDFLDGVGVPSLIAVFRAVEWDNFGLITVDSPLIYSTIDVLLGGRRGTAPMRVEGRAYTTIERSLVERLILLVLQDMETAFEPLSRVTFRFERLETNPRFAAIARPTNAAIMFRIRVEMDDRGGILQLLVPYATFEPVRDLLLQMFMGEKFGRDSIWETHLAKEMLVTDVELEAVLEEQLVPLSVVVNLEVGSTLLLHTKPEMPITLRCGHVPLLRGRLGRVLDTIAVRIDERLGNAVDLA
jgi:flagellar motor switch protein FliM